EHLDAIVHVDMARRRRAEIGDAAFSEAEIAPPPQRILRRDGAENIGVARPVDGHAENFGFGAKPRMARIGFCGQRDGAEAVGRERLLARQHDGDAAAHRVVTAPATSVTDSDSSVSRRSQAVRWPRGAERSGSVARAISIRVGAPTAALRKTGPVSLPITVSARRATAAS